MEAPRLELLLPCQIPCEDDGMVVYQKPRIRRPSRSEYGPRRNPRPRDTAG